MSSRNNNNVNKKRGRRYSPNQDYGSYNNRNNNRPSFFKMGIGMDKDVKSVFKIQMDVLLAEVDILADKKLLLYLFNIHMYASFKI